MAPYLSGSTLISSAFAVGVGKKPKVNADSTNVATKVFMGNSLMGMSCLTPLLRAMRQNVTDKITNGVNGENRRTAITLARKLQRNADISDVQEPFAARREVDSGVVNSHRRTLLRSVPSVFAIRGWPVRSQPPP